MASEQEDFASPHRGSGRKASGRKPSGRKAAAPASGKRSAGKKQGSVKKKKKAVKFAEGKTYRALAPWQSSGEEARKGPEKQKTIRGEEEKSRAKRKFMREHPVSRVEGCLARRGFCSEKTSPCKCLRDAWEELRTDLIDNADDEELIINIAEWGADMLNEIRRRRKGHGVQLVGDFDFCSDHFKCDPDFIHVGDEEATQRLRGRMRRLGLSERD